MTMFRTLSRVLGATALAVALATAVPAAATPRTATDPGPSYRVTPPDEDPPPPTFGAPRRTIFSEVVVLSGRLYLRGDVEKYGGRSVAIQKRRCDTCRWRQYSVVKTGKRGWFRAAITAPRRGSTFWRAKVAPSGGYAKSYSAVWETYY